MKSYKPSEMYDDGEWLRPYLELTQTKAQLLPDNETVARIREQILHMIALESISLVA